MMKKRINVLYQCDDRFAFMTGVSFTSLLINASEQAEYHVYILTPDMSLENRDRFHEIVHKYPQIDMTLAFIPAEECSKEIASWNVPSHRGSWVTYYKLLAGSLFDEDSGVDRIIHIGADTLVTGTLEGLADFDFHGAPFAMNWSERLFHCHFRLNYRYAIAEMVFFNLPVWRETGAEERCRRFALKYGKKYDSKDQDILNMEFQFEYAQLPLKYNIYAATLDFSEKHKRKFNAAKVISDKEIKEAYAHPEIIHIPKTFLYRPHEQDSLEPIKDLWWSYLKRSPWKGMKPVPSGEMGMKEKFLRWVYTHASKGFREWFYIASRKYYGLLRAIVQPPYKKDEERIGMRES